MSIFKKKTDETATGLFRNPETKQKLNTALHAPITTPDLNKQGFTAFDKKQVNGGELFSQSIGGGKEYQEFVQRPKGYKPSSTPAPVRETDFGTFSKGNLTKEATSQSEAQHLKDMGYNIATSVDSPYQDNGLKTPDFYGGLPAGEEGARREALQTEISGLRDQANEEVRQIIETGRHRLGEAKSFLSKIGALGRTISGAPLDTNLGILDEQNNMMKKAVDEAHSNLTDAISKAKTGSQAAAQERVDALNELIQKNFDNALKLAQEERDISSDERADTLADLQIKKFGFEIDKANNQINRENMQDAINQIKEIAKSPMGSLDEVALESLNVLAQTAGLDANIFPDYFQALQSEANLSTEENKARIAQIESSILDQAERTRIAQQQANTSAYSASTSAKRLSFEQEKYEEEKTENPGGYSEGEVRKLRNAGIDPKNVREADDFLYTPNPSSGDIRAAYSGSIDAGENLETIFGVLKEQGIDPYASGYKDLTKQAIEAQINAWIAEKISDKDIRKKLITLGVPEEEVKNTFDDMIEKAPSPGLLNF